MKLIAKKPCSFGGKRFYIGDEIPGEFVLSPIDQEKLGVLTIVNDAAAVIAPAEPGAQPAMVPLIVRGQDGDTTMEMDAESIQTVVDVLTAKAEDAAELIQMIDSDDILFLVNATDSRKTVQAAAKARAKALAEAEPEENPEESAGEQ